MRRSSTAFRYIDLEAGGIQPVIESEWWSSHVKYSSFNRQGIDIFCAAFRNPNAKAKIIFVTGWNETFLKYAELVKILYNSGYSVYAYDHQSQGLSGRWLVEEQTTWIYSFDDYVQDFLFYANMVNNEEINGRQSPPPQNGNNDNYNNTSNSSQLNKKLPLYTISHSMGGLVVGVAIARNPTLVDRAVFTAPGFRFKCAMKALDYQGPLPLPIAYAINWTVCVLGLGQMHCLGWFKEKPSDPVSKMLTTDDEQRELQRQLRMKHPSIISCCPTGDWLVKCLDAQHSFAPFYTSIRTPCLIFKTLEASMDMFIHNKAIEEFAMRARSCRVFEVDSTRHELLLEKPKARGAIHRTILQFFGQEKPEINKLDAKPGSPLRLWRRENMEKTWPEVTVRIVATVAATFGIITGMSMMLSSYQGRMK